MSVGKISKALIKLQHMPNESIRPRLCNPRCAASISTANPTIVVSVFSTTATPVDALMR